MFSSCIKFLMCLFVSLSALSYQNPFSNFNEGKSKYLTYFKKDNIKRIGKKINKERVASLFDSIFSNTTKFKVCDMTVLKELKKEVSQTSSVKFHRNYDDLLLYARVNNVIDDMAFNILVKTYSEMRKEFSKADVDKKSKVIHLKKEEHQSLSLSIKNWREASVNKCMKLSSLSLRNEVKENLDLNKRQLEGIFFYARKKRIITDVELTKIMASINSSKELRRMTLSKYWQKLDDINELVEGEATRSDYVSSRAKKRKLSHRETMYMSFDVKQIILLNNVIEKFKVRFGAAEARIGLYNYDGTLIEDILLSPMEQYRFAAKMIKRDKAILQNGDFFEGKGIQFSNILAAAFELKSISGEELKFVLKIKELWNPKLTKGEKVFAFIRKYSFVAGVLVPPSYIALLPIVISIVESVSSVPSGNGTSLDINIF